MLGDVLSCLGAVSFAGINLYVLRRLGASALVKALVGFGCAAIVLNELLYSARHASGDYGPFLIDVNGPLGDIFVDYLFVAVVVALTGGFYASLYELGMRNRRSESDREALAKKVEEIEQTQAAMHDAQERYRQLFEGSRDGVVLLDEQFRTIQFNPRFAEMFGFTQGEIARISPVDLIHPDDRDMVLGAHRQRVADRDIDRVFEFRMLRKSGELVFVSGSFDAIRRGDEFLCMHCVVRDITERKYAEDALRFRLDLESIVASASSRFVGSGTGRMDINIMETIHAVGEFAGADRAYVFQFSPDARTVSNTHEWCRDGIAAEIEGLKSIDVDSDLPEFAAVIRQSSPYLVPGVEGLSHDSAEYGRFKDQCIQSLFVVPLNFEGTLIGFWGLDFVTEKTALSRNHIKLMQTVGEIMAGAIARRRAEADLLSSEERYRTILNDIIEGYYEADLDGTVYFCNESLAAIFGYSREEFLGRNYEVLNPASEYPHMVASYEKVLESGVPIQSCEWKITRKDGAIGDVEVSISLIRDDTGAPSGYRGIVRDVSGRKRAEAERDQLDLQIQRAQKLESLGQLAGGIAHDFNNLMMGVMANADLAKNQLPDESPARANIEQIETSARVAADLAVQMLLYAGKGSFETRPVFLETLVAEIANLIHASVPRQIALEYAHDGTSPQVNVDPTRLRQVVLNLIINASDAIVGEGRIQVRTGTVVADSALLSKALLNYGVREGPLAYIEVRDTGCGMDAATVARVFDPFFSTKFAGRGLGLASVTGILRAHLGAIVVESRPGEGTCFTVLLSPHAGVIPASIAPKQGQSAHGSLSGTALVIDDDEMIRTAVARILERSGFEVLTASDGVEGCEVFAANREKISFVLLDMAMPRMNGAEAFKKLHSIDPKVRVILSSGFPESDMRAQFGDHAPAAFIQKPQPMSVILDKIRAVLA